MSKPETELSKVSIKAEGNKVTMQMSSDKIPAFEKWTLADVGVEVTGALTGMKITESLTIDDDAPSDDRTKNRNQRTLHRKSLSLSYCFMDIKKKYHIFYSSVLSIKSMIDRCVINILNTRRPMPFLCSEFNI